MSVVAFLVVITVFALANVIPVKSDAMEKWSRYVKLMAVVGKRKLPVIRHFALTEVVPSWN
jgi:hypothetical protein